MAVYPGDPELRIEPAATVERDGYAVCAIHCGDQTGTHLETQAHFLAGKTLDQQPPERFVGCAAIVDVPCGRIEIADLAPAAERVRTADFLLLRSGYAGPLDPQAPGRPWLTAEAVRWVIEAGVRLLGIDCFDFDVGPEYAGHKALLAADVLILEGLTNLQALGEFEPLVVVAPLPLAGTPAAPCRVFALRDLDR
jgi:kynurenine formamidase